ncbi:MULTISPECIES: hypothetical protein [unclassified Streptomyces]|uniref:hypothetical protein n=1 Tax=unclassified Streptomyces TaxID=2593676 RepID=UPI0038236BA0
MTSAPRVDYTEAEQQTWRTVHQQLWDSQREHACHADLDAREQAPFPTDHIPQHAEVGLHLRRLTGPAPHDTGHVCLEPGAGGEFPGPGGVWSAEHRRLAEKVQNRWTGCSATQHP